MDWRRRKVEGVRLGIIAGRNYGSGIFGSDNIIFVVRGFGKYGP
jgi:hypothetical protein